MEQRGLTIDDAELITISFPNMPPTFTNSAIYAALILYPLAAKSTNDSSAAMLIKGDEIGGTIQNGLMYFGKRFLDPKK